MSHLRIASLLCRSAWVECSSPSVRLFVCLSVCPEHNSKTNDPKVFKLGTNTNTIQIQMGICRARLTNCPGALTNVRMLCETGEL